MPNKILIVRTDRMGDVLLTLPMAQVLKEKDGSSFLGILVKPYTASLVKLSPAIDEIVQYEDVMSFFHLVNLLKRGKWNVILFPNPKVRLVLAAFFASIPIRIGTAYRWYSFLFTNRILEHRKLGDLNEAEYNVRMLRPLNIYGEESPYPILIYSDAEHTRENILLKFFQDREARYVVLHIGTGGSSHEWPLTSFGEFAKWVASSLKFSVILTGTNLEWEKMKHVAERLKESGVKAKLLLDYSIPELFSILQGAELVLSNSTGPGHLAAATGAPTVGLFPLPLALSKERWGFRGPFVTNISAPAIEKCPYCKVCTCMERLEVHSVEQVALSLLGR